MTVKRQKIGPGVLTIGAVGSPLDLSSQITNTRLTPSVDKEDARKTLSGEEIAGTRTVTWVLAGTMIQDLSDGGVVDWIMSHAGEEVPFTFTPNTALGTDFTGTLIVDPVEVGGDVDTEPETDFEFELVGQPVFAAGLG